MTSSTFCWTPSGCNNQLRKGHEQLTGEDPWLGSCEWLWASLISGEEESGRSSEKGQQVTPAPRLVSSPCPWLGSAERLCDHILLKESIKGRLLFGREECIKCHVVPPLYFNTPVAVQFTLHQMCSVTGIPFSTHKHKNIPSSLSTPVSVAAWCIKGMSSVPKLAIMSTCPKHYWSKAN